MVRNGYLPERTVQTGLADVEVKAMVYKLVQSAEKRWKHIKGFKRLTLVLNNEKFITGEW